MRVKITNAEAAIDFHVLRSVVDHVIGKEFDAYSAGGGSVHLIGDDSDGDPLGSWFFPRESFTEIKP